MGTGFEDALAAAPRGNDPDGDELEVVVVERGDGDEQAARAAPAPPAASRPSNWRRPRERSKSEPASDPEVMFPLLATGRSGVPPAACSSTA